MTSVQHSSKESVPVSQTTSFINTRFAGQTAYLYRTFVLCEEDAENSIPRIEIRQYTSVYGSSSLIHCRIEDQDRSVLVGPEIFSANSLLVLNNEDDSERVAIIGTDAGMSIITLDAAVDALNSGAGQLVADQIDDFWPVDESYHLIASHNESSVRQSVDLPVIIAENAHGELYGFTFDSLVGDDEYTPMRIGVPSVYPERTYLHFDGERCLVTDSAEEVNSDDSVSACFVKDYGVDSKFFTSGDDFSVDIPRLANSKPLSLHVSIYKSDEVNGILVTNTASSRNTMSVYLHGGPEHYITSVHDLFASDSELLALIEKSRCVFVPFLKRSTDYGTSEDFLWTGELSVTPLLGEDASEVDELIHAIARIMDDRMYEPATLYAVSQGAHTALGMIAYADPDALNKLFSRIVLNNGLLDVDDPFDSGSFNALQLASLRNGIDFLNNPVDEIGSEEWVALNHSVDHPTVTIVCGNSDPICHASTAYELAEHLSIGDFDARVFIDDFSQDHELSPGAKLYTVSQM